jgi:dienelactone hydrolase
VTWTAARALAGCALAAVVCAIGTSASPSVARAAAPGAPAFRVHTFRFVDRSRTIRLPDGRSVPRPLDTVVRTPSPPGPHPLIVFGHGFALAPSTYRGLLDAWARAGYVVAAPVFPLTNAGAPGGPDESDLVNQPRDVSVVVSSLLALSARPGGVLAGSIDASRIAVAGHSDGAVTALAVAYDRRFRDTRVRAAIVLSGATPSGMGPFPRRGPPLLAVQGTADAINAPGTTAAFFRRARRPKFLLWLLGASHRPPYTYQEPQLRIVEQATAAFLDHYLRGRPLRAFDMAAKRPGLTRLTADP